MDITLDIGAAVLGLVTVIVIPGFAWIMNRNREKDIATLQQQEREYQTNLRKYDELKEAVEIHASLTALQVTEAIEQPDSDEAAKQFLVALHRRSSARFDAFSKDFEIPDNIAELAKEAFAAIHKRWKAETAESQSIFLAKVEQNHEKSEWVQTRITEFVERITEVTNTEGEWKGAFVKAEVSSGGQSVHLVLPDGVNSIRIAGANTDELPKQVMHRQRPEGAEDGKWGSKSDCALNRKESGINKDELKKHNNSGTELADAFLRELKRLAGSASKGKCTCGIPFIPTPGGL